MGKQGATLRFSGKQLSR